MIGLTRQEKQAVLFLFVVAAFGLGINFCLKFVPPSKKIISFDENTFKLNLNKVCLEELLRCRGISRKLAKEIIDYRDANGNFVSLEGLKQVKGIGQYRYERLKQVFFLE